MAKTKSIRPSPEVATVRRIAQGEIVGFVADNGAHVWRAIPFAASTAGDNRWRAPRPPAGWEGTRSAVDPAERCAQLTNRSDREQGLEPGLVIGSEDCLTLDIYAPANLGGDTLPVMVWIHGGGNVWGGSSKYDGSQLALNEDVIVVAVQHRVGLLGWFSHEALRAEAEEVEDTAASFATLDLIASLRWVRENIASFGGDAECVTIFGESSGGHNVVTLLASPLAHGLFHRAIVQSGSFDSVSAAEAEGLEGELVNTSRDLAARLGAATADDLRAVSVEALYGACVTGGSWFLDVPRVIQDGVALPSTPLREAFASVDTFNAVPIITGTNRDEMKLFYLADDSMTRRILGRLPVAHDPDLYDAMAHYVSRMWRIRSVDEPAARMIEAGHDAVYSYRFDWDDGGRFLSVDFGRLLGAAHGFEIPFVFNRFEHLGNADRLLFQKKTLADRRRLSRIMGGLWASFARNGAPSHPDAPVWPTYGDDASFMRLDTVNGGGLEVVRRADSLERLATDLKIDPRLDAAMRRRIVSEETVRWMFTRPIRRQLEALTGYR